MARIASLGGLPARSKTIFCFVSLRVRPLPMADCPELRPEALCALTNIASTEFTKAVATEPSTLPTLMALLSSPDVHLREQVGARVGFIVSSRLI